MELAEGGQGGLALGAWGAVQASTAGAAIALGGVMRDVVAGLAAGGALGPALTTSPAAGYGAVYQLEILLLFATLAAIGPLVRPAGAAAARERRPSPSSSSPRFGLAEVPG
jgi:BCD family chlorophyll transporter-like MFS transporter